MDIAARWIVCVLAGMAALHPLKCHAENTQTVLSKFREDIEQTCVQNAKPADVKIRETILQQLKSRFTKSIQSVSAPDKTVAQHFDTLLDNITAANNGFRFKDGAKFREQFIRDAATTFVKEVKSATDLIANRTPSGWFETFAGMFQQIRDRLALYKGLGAAVSSTLSPVFMEVYRASTMNTQTDAVDDYKEQLATVKKFFPTTKPDLKEKNGSFATLLEGHANTVFKERTK